MVRSSSQASTSASTSASSERSPIKSSIHHLDLAHLASSTATEDFSQRRRLEEVSIAIAKAKKVVVVSGAGISCSSGIPDFRSENGLYSLVKKRFPKTFVTGKDLFSSGLFSNPATTAVFLSFIAELSLSCQKANPTRTHHFIHKLDKSGKLLRSYTQNVDGFERRLGMESGGRGQGLSKGKTRNVELHGDLGRIRCTLCMTDYPARDEWVEEFREGNAPACPVCDVKCSDRIARGQRAVPIGTLRPAIVLYDEPHPLGDDIGELTGHDLRRTPDVLLIMGTSLKVHGLKALVKNFAKSVHSDPRKKGLVVFVNATKPGKEWEGIIDVHVQGETDMWTERVEEVWRRVKPGDWEVQTTLEGAQLGPASAPVTKKAGGAGKKNSKPILTAGQLPTPRPSTSPSRAGSDSPTRGSTSDRLPATTDFPSPPPSPLSPSKRRANAYTPPPDDASPAKKTKPTILAPTTGVPGTPGRGNLFASPAKAIVNQNEEWEDDFFGSPEKRAGAIKARPVAKSSAKSGAVAKGKTARTEGEKENTPVKVTTSAKARATMQKRRVRPIVEKRKGLRVAA